MRVPKKNSCYGENISPPLEWKEVPEGTRSFAIIAEDLDYSTDRLTQWVAYNIPADVTALPEGVPTSTAVLPDGTTQGTNDKGQPGYEGICPAPIIRPYFVDGSRFQILRGPHRLEVRIYALDIELGLAPGVTKVDLEVAMEDHILGEAKTMGKFQPPVTNMEQLQVFVTRTAEAQQATSTSTP